MDVTVNGTNRSTPERTTLDRLVTQLLGQDPAGIAVAVNGTVVPRTSWTGHVLAPGDRVEVVTAFQGG